MNENNTGKPVPMRKVMTACDPLELNKHAARHWKSRLPKPSETSNVPKSSPKPAPSQQQPPQAKN